MQTTTYSHYPKLKDAPDKQKALTKHYIALKIEELDTRHNMARQYMVAAIKRGEVNETIQMVKDQAKLNRVRMETLLGNALLTIIEKYEL